MKEFYRRLVDLGCGNGLFSLFLARLYPQMEIIGADIDERKLEAARAMAATARLDNLSFVQADVSGLHIPRADFYLCVDLLYLLPFEVQEKTAEAVAAAMEPGGTFLLKEMDTRPAWKCRLFPCRPVTPIRIPPLSPANPGLPGTEPGKSKNNPPQIPGFHQVLIFP